MSDVLPYSGSHPWLPQRVILLVNHGSRAYGLDTPTSDVDIQGVAVPPRSHFFGFTNSFDQATQKNPDMTVHEIRRFFALASDAQPAMLEMLWAAPEDYRILTEAGRRILARRDLFLSTKVKHSFTGFAFAQLKKLKSDARLENGVTLYDGKKAMHAVRLLRMCRETLTTGEVRVRRDDRDELLAIRNGAWPFLKLVEWADAEDTSLHDLRLSSKLPHSPDRAALDELCVSIVEDMEKRA